jgi:hypothetical protein
MSGLIGAFGRAFAPIKEKDAAWPVLDATTIAWLALILVAYLVPRVSEITLGGASLKLLENVDKATGKYQGTINDLSGLLQNWLESELILMNALAGADDSGARLAFMNFLRDRMGEARKWLSDDPAANVRISLWIYDADNKVLEFLFSNEIDDKATTDAQFEPGEGLMGQAFAERRFWNEAKAREIPGFRPLRPSSGYDAVMTVPVELPGNLTPLGMLNFDKKGDKFSDAAENIGLALSALCAFALSEYSKDRS